MQKQERIRKRYPMHIKGECSHLLMQLRDPGLRCCNSAGDTWVRLFDTGHVGQLWDLILLTRSESPDHPAG